MKKNIGSRLLTLPAIIVVLIVTQIPIIITIYYSLFRWSVVRPDLPNNFVGFSYYKELLTGDTFWIVLKNTINITFIPLAICLLLGTFLAFLLYRPFPGVGIARTLLISPFFIMDSVIGVFWRNVIMEPTYGLISQIGNFFGISLKNLELLSQHPILFINTLIIWKWTPFFMLVVMAGLQSIPNEVVEASLIDGASTWGRIQKIIIPMIMKYITISLILGLIFILKTFGLIFTTTLGGPGFSSTNFPYYVYRKTFLGWDVGRGSAIAVFVVIISLVIIMALFKFLRKSIVEEEI